MTGSKDDYGVLGNKIEVDSDVNEDRNREERLDDSFEAWYGKMGEQIKQKMELTNVPKDNVFDAAEDLEEK
ncbi:hypothetical protein ACFSL6_21145 [Paenibacillus thailandensis]|uniref:DUF4025 domain-containing protein n=1 Tax=Paenibacillus thailandensis TaxID=393250 RepID=A0ABW5QYK9_9BACL